MIVKVMKKDAELNSFESNWQAGGNGDDIC